MLNNKKRLNAILAQELSHGVKIELEPHDEAHLDCTWYGGEVGRITYPDGWALVIEARGDIRLIGHLEGYGEVDLKDKNDGGEVWNELGRVMDDDRLYQALENDEEDSDFLYFSNNNWFELNAIAPSGVIVDLFNCDNILDNNLLECFEHIEVYEEYLSWAKEDYAESSKTA